MKLIDLQTHIEQLIAQDIFRSEAEVTFGADFQPVEGGIIAKHRESGLVVLNLAPTKLDRVGGF